MMGLLSIPCGVGISSLPFAIHRAAPVLRSRRAAIRPGQWSSGYARGGGPSRPISSMYACGPPMS